LILQRLIRELKGSRLIGSKALLRKLALDRHVAVSARLRRLHAIERHAHNLGPNVLQLGIDRQKAGAAIPIKTLPFRHMPNVTHQERRIFAFTQEQIGMGRPLPGRRRNP
jgi:hypothetical protein